MTKKLFEIYVTYGKGSGEELDKSWVAEDTPEERLKALEDGCVWADEWDEDPADFEEGQISTIGFSSYGDWDDPTGGYLRVVSYNDKMGELQSEYLSHSRAVKKLFEKEID